MKTRTKFSNTPRRPVNWKVRPEIRKAVRVAIAQDDTTHEEYLERLLMADLSRRKLIDPATIPAG